jgi:SAM-dependent methyltransferase
MIEFTGERVIPDQVEVDLWNEHYARYLFASRFAGKGLTVDLGCGTGYGTALLAQKGPAVGLDASAEAVAYARKSYPRAHFLQASATGVPIHSGSAHLVTAFELIEHLEDWPVLLKEARRLLHPSGVFLVSTPNREYYNESRGAAGSNPYHVHEFSYAEFEEELRKVFPSVDVLVQNRMECVAFHAYRYPWPAEVEFGGSSGNVADSHFYLAICAAEPTPTPFYVYVPKAANVLREREHHIARLQRELHQKDEWLAKSRAEHAELLQLHADQLRQLEERNRWAKETEDLWKQAQTRIVELQEQFAQQQAVAQAKIEELEQENVRKTEWARSTEERLTRELQAKVAELGEAVQALHRTEASLDERTQWALQLQMRVQHLETMLAGVKSSRWIRIGRTLGAGPKVSLE